MKIIADPYGTPTELAEGTRLRFTYGEHFIEVYERHGAIVVRSDGFYGPIRIQPCVSNEIEVTPTPIQRS